MPGTRCGSPKRTGGWVHSLLFTLDVRRENLGRGDGEYRKERGHLFEELKLGLIALISFVVLELGCLGQATDEKLIGLESIRVKDLRSTSDR